MLRKTIPLISAFTLFLSFGILMSAHAQGDPWGDPTDGDMAPEVIISGNPPPGDVTMTRNTDTDDGTPTYGTTLVVTVTANAKGNKGDRPPPNTYPNLISEISIWSVKGDPSTPKNRPGTYNPGDASPHTSPNNPGPNWVFYSSYVPNGDIYGNLPRSASYKRSFIFSTPGYTWFLGEAKDDWTGYGQGYSFWSAVLGAYHAI